jgi:hypothetical protein
VTGARPGLAAPLERLRALLPLVASALLAAFVVSAWHHLAGKRYIDFYNPWAVTLGHRALGGNPYADGDAYSRLANLVADTGGSPALRATNADRRVIDPTGTPLYYAAFAWLPSSFEIGYGIVAAALAASLLGAVWALARMHGLARWAAAALAACVALLYMPFEVDLRVGNVNALQLAALVGFIHGARRWREGHRGLAQELYLPALALLVLFKPNIALVAAALAFHFLHARGMAATLRAALWSIGALGLAYAASCLYFHSPGVWRLWWSSLHDANGGTLLYPVGVGNASVAKLLSERWAVHPYVTGALLAAALALFSAAAITAYGKDAAGARARARRVLADAQAMASAGVLLTFAASPLLWPHYEVLLLLPVFFLFGRGRDAASGWVALSCVMLSRPLAQAFEALGVPGATLTVLMFGWVPLAVAFCLRLAQASDAGIKPLEHG